MSSGVTVPRGAPLWDGTRPEAAPGGVGVSIDTPKTLERIKGLKLTTNKLKYVLIHVY